MTMTRSKIAFPASHYAKRMILGTLLLLATFLPTSAFASSVLDVANAIKALQPSMQTSLLSADPVDGATFLNNPTLQTFSNLNSTVLSAVFNNPSISTLVPTLDANVLPSLSGGTLNNTLTNLTAPILQSFQSQAFSLVPSGTLSGVLANVSPNILTNLGESLLTGVNPGTLTTVLSSPLLTDAIRSALPTELFVQLSSGQLSGLLNNFLADPSLAGVLGSLSSNLLTGAMDPNILTNAIKLIDPSLIPLLPGTLFANVSLSGLTSIFENIPTNISSLFTSEFFSALPTETMSGLLSDLSTSVTGILGGDLLSAFTSEGIADILSGMDFDALAGLTDVFENLSAETFSDLLGGNLLSADVIEGLGGALFEGIDAGTLAGTFEALGVDGIAALSGDLATSLFSSMDTSVLSGALSAVTGGLTGALGSAVTGMLPAGIANLIPGFGGIGLFVPVFDVALVPAFKSYSNAFNKYASNMDKIIATGPDSLRNIIAGGNPKGVAKEYCNLRDANDSAWAWAKDSSWGLAVASSSGKLPATIPEGGTIGAPWTEYVRIIGQGEGGAAGTGNDSGSIRCILTALVGYQKTALYVQFHSLLKQYISDAQQQQLSNQLLNKINAANLSWAREGEKVSSGGVESTEPVYVLNSDQSQYARNTRNIETVVGQAAAQAGDPSGSFELCASYSLDIATQVAQNLRQETDDRRSFTTEATKCTLTAGDGGPFASVEDIDDYMEDPNTAKGPGAIAMLGYAMNNPQDMPLTAFTIVKNEAYARLQEDKERYQRELLGSGFQPTQKCSGTSSDPYCDPALTINVSSVAQNQATVVSAVESGKEQIANSDFLDTTSADAAEDLSTEANTESEGVYGYDTTGLASTQTGVNRLIQELYDIILYSYFDLNGDQEEWAAAALLSIYDGMIFDDTQPRVAVPTNKNSLEAEYVDY
ncbi:MAG: hypothetical protein A3D65_05380 [Candidatus Lloydbacteria bacterium RIFCSPHIGHO2_02_FULL_50_13]|uniref:Uncharacterized protein n=1 Tax=Candidatus Lloydbacteria bacterium RIFCSPHIGHO2_02_FULL_50_13 TaxID=1798661 RepID=A0A1G2D9X2_9BACT|nr:MAG: hypothetical protein A3D65_05380 [Candidatus Lloydbacteria bacterium RIFCSPHIGHO2_02_FULL_50_13]